VTSIHFLRACSGDILLVIYNRLLYPPTCSRIRHVNPSVTLSGEVYCFFIYIFLSHSPYNTCITFATWLLVTGSVGLTKQMYHKYWSIERACLLPSPGKRLETLRYPHVFVDGGVRFYYFCYGLHWVTTRIQGIMKKMRDQFTIFSLNLNPD
jgi:hypothetical protein